MSFNGGHPDSFGTRQLLGSLSSPPLFFSLESLEKRGIARVSHLPFSTRVLLENLLRNEDGCLCRAEHVDAVIRTASRAGEPREIPFMPARVLMQDFTGVPAVADLAAMRDAVASAGKDPSVVNPVVPVDLVVDHSIQVDHFGSPGALDENNRLEFARNAERYAFLKWAQKSFRQFRIVPPGIGIIHQINIEHLASVVHLDFKSGTAYPDTCVGTDSHTTMVNALGVLGWGVGGIEAEAVMLGQPYFMGIPAVVGLRLSGALREGVTATDLVLTITQILRKHGVVGKFVEFFGPGLDALGLADRSVVANMAPEYGATVGFFPVDDSVIDYLRLTGRDGDLIDLVECYCKEQGLFRTAATPEIVFSTTVELDLSCVEPSLAGPKRPHDRVALKHVAENFKTGLTSPVAERGFGLSPRSATSHGNVEIDGQRYPFAHGTVVIAAITSCTNTSNPHLMVAAGLVAKRACERGLKSKPWVKTSLAPGSRVVTEYLENSGLLKYLEELRFHVVGYGCTTCIGNSGPLPEEVETAIRSGDFVAVSVLSGNRNFEGRIHPSVRANYLASPPLVVAYALAGRVDLDFQSEPVGLDPRGAPVFLRDLWPSREDIFSALGLSLSPDTFKRVYADVFEGGVAWRGLEVPESILYHWDDRSTYIRRPPFFDGANDVPHGSKDFHSGRILAIFGDSITTDHISPAGSIAAASPAGRYLKSLGISQEDFNTYGSRRGNHEVMVRGTFANVRLKNLLVPGVEGGVTRHAPSGDVLPIYDAASRYAAEGTPLVVIAGKDYGSGSSRDWAAKGTLLLGVRAVLARSFERIHRGNLVGMGVLPLELVSEAGWEGYGLGGGGYVSIIGLDSGLKPNSTIEVEFTGEGVQPRKIPVRVRLDSEVEVEYYVNGGILAGFIRNMT